MIDVSILRRTEEQIRDMQTQQAIAAQLSPLYMSIDLTIPAQRLVADRVRAGMKLPPLGADLMGEMNANDEIRANTQGEK